MKRKIRVSTISLELPDGITKMEENIDRALLAIDNALINKPDIICLPECYPIHGSSKEDIIKSTKHVDEINEKIGNRAHEGKCYIISTILESFEDKVYNTAFLIDRSGNIAGKYRKTHLAAFENDLYGNVPGSELPVFETDFGRIAIMICMDIHVVEVARVYGLKGAEIIFWPTQAYGPSGEFLMTILKARAIDNQVRCVASNFCSKPYFPGKSMGRACIVGLDGVIISDTGNRPGIATADIDLDEQFLTDWRYTQCSEALQYKYPNRKSLFYGLRRAELYGTITDKRDF